MDYNQIKQIIDDNIKTNTSQDITAIVGNAVMTAMIDYTRDAMMEAMGAIVDSDTFTWMDVQTGSVVLYPQMSAGRAKVIRMYNGSQVDENGSAIIGGADGVEIRHHSLVICLESTNEQANDGTQQSVGNRFAVINFLDDLTLEQVRSKGNEVSGNIIGSSVFLKNNNRMFAQIQDIVEAIANIVFPTLDDLGGVPNSRKITINGESKSLSSDVEFEINTKTETEDGEIAFQGDGTIGSPLKAEIAEKVYYKSIHTLSTEPTLAQLNAYGTDRVDCPNVDRGRIYFLNGAMWTYVETIQVIE